MACRKDYIPTLCWECKNALGKCSWSESFIPVRGWKAIPTEIKQVAGGTIIQKSFIVTDCPQFMEG